MSALLFALWALAACAPASRTGALTPVTEPTRRLELPGLSVLPPRGENWFITPRIPELASVPAVNVAAFAKKLDDGARAAGAVVYASVNVWDLKPWRLDNPEAFLRFVTEDLERGTPRQRVLTLEVKDANSPAPTCARYRRTTELRGAPGLPDATFLLATGGVWCLHPHWPQYGIDIAYGQRVPAGASTLPVDAEVEPFINSVVFTRERPRK